MLHQVKEASVKSYVLYVLISMMFWRGRQKTAARDKSRTRPDCAGCWDYSLSCGGGECVQVQKLRAANPDMTVWL